MLGQSVMKTDTEVKKYENNRLSSSIFDNQIRLNYIAFNKLCLKKSETILKKFLSHFIRGDLCQSMTLKDLESEKESV